MLIDAGCELDSYAADITRTFPVDGKFSGGAEGRLRAGARLPGSGHQGREAGRGVHRLPRCRHARPGARLHRHEALQGQRRQGAGRRVVQAVLHAPHRPLAGPRRARRRRLHAQGQVEEAQARHGAHGGAGLLHPPGGQGAQAFLEHRRAHRGRRPRHREGPRDPHRRLSRSAWPTSRPRSGASGKAPEPWTGSTSRSSGAGPVGAALAALLVPGGRTVRVLEARDGPSRDARTLALSQASREFLEEAGGWPATGVTPIVDIHVSQKGGPGRTLITAGDQGLAALGYTVAYAALEAVLERRARRPRRERFVGDAPARRSRWKRDGAMLQLAGGGRLEARLLVLADGGVNARRIPGLAYSEKDYGQVAITGPVRTDRPHGGRAYERFTPRGPVALLPVERSLCARVDGDAGRGRAHPRPGRRRVPRASCRRISATAPDASSRPARGRRSR